MWYVYITKDARGAFYIGMSHDVEGRFEQHIKGQGGRYTKYNCPVEIVYTEKFIDRALAVKRECQLKKWSRAKKQALISSNIPELKKLSISRD